MSQGRGNGTQERKTNEESNNGEKGGKRLTELPHR